MSRGTIKIIGKDSPRVFISHSTKNADVAAAICAAVEHRGIRCWIAPRDISSGRDWAEEIMSGIERCRVMVIVWSSHSNRSRPVMSEVERAVSKGLAIIPFRIEHLQPSKSFEFFFATTQWLDAITPPLLKHINKLADQVVGLLEASRPRSQPPWPEQSGTGDERRGPVPIVTEGVELPPDEWDKPRGRKRPFLKTLLDD